MVVRKDTSVLHGAKIMYTKDKLSVIMCIGSDGTKFPLCIIGKSKKPLLVSI